MKYFIWVLFIKHLQNQDHKQKLQTKWQKKYENISNLIKCRSYALCLKAALLKILKLPPGVKGHHNYAVKGRLAVEDQRMYFTKRIPEQRSVQSNTNKQNVSVKTCENNSCQGKFQIRISGTYQANLQYWHYITHHLAYLLSDLLGLLELQQVEVGGGRDGHAHLGLAHAGGASGSGHGVTRRQRASEER